MREAGKPFPGRMGIEPKTFCERVESRRQNGMRPRRPGGQRGKTESHSRDPSQGTGVASTGLRRSCSVPGKGARLGGTLPGREAFSGTAGKVRHPSGRRRPSRDLEVRDLCLIRPAVFAEGAGRLRPRAAAPPLFGETAAMFSPLPGFRSQSGRMSGGSDCLRIPIVGAGFSSEAGRPVVASLSSARRHHWEDAPGEPERC